MLPIIHAPGFARINAYTMLRFGQQLRDDWLWTYPILPGAVVTYQQMSSGREWRISANTNTAASRAITYLHEAQSRTYDGLVDIGFEAFEKRRVLDNLSLGRTLFYASETEPLTYLDPAYTHYNRNTNEWQESYTGKKYPAAHVIVNHPIPVGSLGNFVSPLSFVVPTAMLAWLVREHDKAAVDGRKIRDILIVASQEMADQIKSNVEQLIAMWSGEVDPSKSGIDIVSYEDSSDRPIADTFARIGISNIPPNFDRMGFQFEYVNEIAAALGISLRHFWNSERATNRALEEVQEARQMQKGPSSYVRTEQRLLASSGILQKRFGSSVRFAFVEEVDVQSQRTKAEVLKMYSEALGGFASVFGGNVNGDAFLGWLQSESILPADLELITDMGTLMEGDADHDPNNTIESGDPNPSPLTSGTRRSEKSAPLDYGEVTLDSNYRVVEKRVKVFTVEKLIEEEILSDPERMKQLQLKEELQREGVSFQKALAEAHDNNAKSFFSSYSDASAVNSEYFEKSIIEDLFSNKDSLTDSHHRIIKALIDETL